MNGHTSKLLLYLKLIEKKEEEELEVSTFS